MRAAVKTPFPPQLSNATAVDTAIANVDDELLMALAVVVINCGAAAMMVIEGGNSGRHRG